MRTRLKDIAENLNISAGLVSGVLNGRDNVWASEETRNRIFEAAKRMNYLPSGLTSSPKASKPLGSSGTIELIYCRRNFVAGKSFASIVDALSTDAEQRGFSLNVRSFSDSSRACEYLSAQSTTRTSPFVLWGEEQDVADMATVLRMRGIPFIANALFQFGDQAGPHVAMNVEEMVVGAIDHIRVLGHSRIAYLGSIDSSSRSRLMRDAFVNWSKSSLGEAPSDEYMVESECTIGAFRHRLNDLFERTDLELPTGYVIGAGNEAWSALEICLNERGAKLGFSRANHTAAGTYEGPLHLLFGDALGYDLGQLDARVSATLRPMLTSIFDGVEDETDKLFVPRLARIPSLHLDRSPTTGKSPEVSS